MSMPFFTMRFAFLPKDRNKGIHWSGPYEVPAGSETEAKDILTDAILNEMRVEDSPIFEIRLLEVENKTHPCRGEEHYASVSIQVKDEIYRRSMRMKYPDGIPPMHKRLRSLDAQWEC
jgi:hypothetical protein